MTDSGHRQNRLLPLLLVLAATALPLVLLWLTPVPLGVPGEWVWPRLPLADQLLPGLVLAVPAGTFYVLLVLRGYRVFPQLSSRMRGLWLLGLMLAGLLWTAVVIQSTPGLAGPPRLPLVLYYPRTEGYFWQARHDVDSLGEFVRTYPDRIRDSSVPENYLHLGTHPPGLTLSYCVLWNLFDSSPMLCRTVLSVQPVEVHEWMEQIRQNSALHGQIFDQRDEACLWAAICLTLLLCVGTVGPLYLLARQTTSPQLAWLGAAMWPLVPAVLVFLPKSDLLYPSIAVSAQCCWLISLHKQRYWFSAIAGLLLYVGTWLTLAFVPVGAMLFVQAVAAIFDRTHRSSAIRTLLAGAAGFCGPLLLTLFSGVPIVSIWWLNYHNHAAFYEHSTRTFAMWLWVNPLEFLGALGAPMVAWGALERWKQDRCGTLFREWTTRTPVLVVWMLLWLTGKNMGEAARLWCLLFPLAIWLLLPAVSDSDDEPQLTSRVLIAALVGQLLICFGTAIRIDGFDFGAFAK